MGFKYDDTKTPEARMPSRWELDEVSREHPVIVTHRAGLKSSGNSMALDEFKVTRDSRGPISGPYEKDPESGEPNGVMYEAGEERIRFFLLSQITPEERRRGLQTITTGVRRRRPDQRPRRHGHPRRGQRLPGRMAA